jgi:histidine triad (HIT) family protein
MDCLFCKIADKKIPAQIVYEDDTVVAFEDINPQAPVHILIIPRKHIPRILDITDDDQKLVGYLFHIASTIAKERGIAEKGFRLVLNCNREAGQTVFHIHLHLVGGRIMHWPPG